jgi:hypothetical protein
MTGLLRVNYTTIPFPNEIVSAPNNISGPFQYNVPNPFGCPTNSVQDGGNLVCGTYANPCTGEIIKQTSASSDSFVCFPNSCSDVPGKPILLCWTNKVQTFNPRPRYYMNNSTDKWPEGYKGFVSAVAPDPPILTLSLVYPPPDPAGLVQLPTQTLSWTFIDSVCLPISSFNIYKGNAIFVNVPYTVTSYIVTGSAKFFVTALSGGVESKPSNLVVT